MSRRRAVSLAESGYKTQSYGHNCHQCLHFAKRPTANYGYCHRPWFCVGPRNRPIVYGGGVCNYWVKKKEEKKIRVRWDDD